MAARGLERELRAIVGDDAVLDGHTRAYLIDATEGRGIAGRADAVALPRTPQEVAAVVRWCYDHDVPIVPRGGGTGLAGGAVPDGGVVVALERLNQVRRFERERWRIAVDAGVTTATVRRLARENGLLFPPDPGAAEQSQIGGNLATNAGGPHAFKYGCSGEWVSGIETVVAPGELVDLGGALRKDVAAYDLTRLVVGSEGTLAIITGAWLRLVPAPPTRLAVVAFYEAAEQGCQAVGRILAAGIVAAAIEYLDAGALDAAAAAFPGDVPAGARFAVLAEADGSPEEAERLRGELVGALAPDALGLERPDGQGDLEHLWRWRDGVSHAVAARRGAKLSEDIVVPIERLGEAIEGTLAIGARHGLEACSWGHAGDGNLHSTFMLATGGEPARAAVETDSSAGETGRPAGAAGLPDGSAGDLERAERAAGELFELAVSLGGSVSGEHGAGIVKAGGLALQLSPRVIELQRQVKRAFDPKGLLNPGKKAAASSGAALRV